MKRKRTSPIWTMPRAEFESLAKRSSSISEMIRFFGFTSSGNVHKSVKQRCREENIDIAHIALGLTNRKGKTFDLPKIALKKVLVKGSTYDRKSLKKRLIEENLLKNCCAICDQCPEWEGAALIMVLDHINGIHDDNRLKNLRLLCPNCNSQQSTFAGRNNKIYWHCKCGAEIHKKTKKCGKCWAKIQPRKVKRPSKEILMLDIKKLGYCGTGRKHEVSDNAIRKWVRSYGLIN